MPFLTRSAFFKRIANKLYLLWRFLFSPDKTFLVQAYRDIFDREIDPQGLDHFVGRLSAGQSRWQVVLSLVRSPEFFEKTLRDHTTSEHNRAFLEEAYQRLFGRAIDGEGLERYRPLLQGGKRREEILFELMASDELVSRILRENTGLMNIRPLKPGQYAQDVNRETAEPLLTFRIENPEDFDWLESMIEKVGYYERPGIWSYGLDQDKQVQSEIVAAFRPDKVLEIGCSNGAILKALRDLNIEAEGVEISAMAIRRAFPEIKAKIYEGDLLELPLLSRYDLVLGLDIFEHLNPNKLDRYIRTLFDKLIAGGFLFCNIPAFGPDPLFETVFPLYLQVWEEDHLNNGLFRHLHVDESGYPQNGHLIWADSHWWVSQFEKAGLVREKEIERALHQKYDPYFDRKAPARKTFYVFSKQADPNRNREIIETVRSQIFIK